MGHVLRLMTAIAGILSGLALASLQAEAFDFPAPAEGTWIAKDFKFHGGEVLPELPIHYTTIGDAKGEPVLILHGTSGSGTSLLTAAFAGQLFGPGQPLDAAKYYIILPDGIGHGKTGKPSDGLQAKFPGYSYDDMVVAQYRLVTEGLGVKHVRLLLGFSMGGMHAWMWGSAHPEFMDALVPMASQPAAMSSRNWMMRRLVIDTIRNDPSWQAGNYKAASKAAQTALVYYLIATNGGTRALAKAAPTREAADKILDARLTAPLATDVTDLLFQYEASRDYDPSAGLEKIDAQVLAINSADDERNPPETGIMEREMKRLKNGSLFVIPGSETTNGHVTVLNAKLWADQLVPLLASAPRRLP